MADPLSVTAGILAIITATIQSSAALYKTVESFRNHQRVIRQLKEELAALNDVLRSLADHVNDNEATFMSLKLPLLRCGEACTGLNVLLANCLKHSEGPRTSVRDWIKIRYMDGDIVAFTNLLAGYKSTVAIALADVNIRSSTVTLKVLHEYKEMIQSTTQDLEDHLSDINDKLHRLRTEPSFAHETIELEHFEKEKDSTEQCIKICEEVMSHLSELRLRPIWSESHQPDLEASPAAHPNARDVTLSTLDGCSQRLAVTSSFLRAQKQEEERLRKQANAQNGVRDTAREISQLESEKSSALECLAICNGASERVTKERVHQLEDMRTGNDGQQIFVSTLGDLFNVRGASSGDRGIQFVGSVSDNTLKLYFQTQEHR